MGQVLVTGANGQLGRALRALVSSRSDAVSWTWTDRDDFDISDAEVYGQIDLSRYGVVVNCGAYTAVDLAETAEGRVACWQANAIGPALLARTCADAGATLVHVSSDYVFDGTCEVHDEMEPYSPLSAYGASKAAGDIAIAASDCDRYLLMTSWLVGDGHNFVRTMCSLSDRVADPEDPLTEAHVVDDQCGRLTFASELARAALHLLDTHAPFGSYNVTCAGAIASWAEIARRTFELRRGNGNAVVPITTAEYRAGMAGPVAPRPSHSAMDLSKIEATGFHPRGWEDMLEEYVQGLG